MGANTTIDSVVTEDVAPSVAPHRVSRDPAYSTAHVTFHGAPDPVAIGPDVNLVPDVPTLTPDTTLEIDTALEVNDGPTPGDFTPSLVGYTVRRGGASVDSGTDLISKGACGALPVSTRRVCGSMTTASGARLTRDVLAADLPSGDGPYTINVYMQVESGGWS